MDIVINVNFKNIQYFKDSERRSEHIFDRMMKRGIFTQQIEEAVRKGPKKLREDSSIVTEFRWFKVVYREFIMKNIKKIYPITVIDNIK